VQQVITTLDEQHILIAPEHGEGFPNPPAVAETAEQSHELGDWVLSIPNCSHMFPSQCLIIDFNVKKILLFPQLRGDLHHC
jgi:hypothetical protein